MERNVASFPDRNGVNLPLKILPPRGLQIRLVFTIPRGRNDQFDIPSGLLDYIDKKTLVNWRHTSVTNDKEFQRLHPLMKQSPASDLNHVIRKLRTDTDQKGRIVMIDAMCIPNVSFRKS